MQFSLEISMHNPNAHFQLWWRYSLTISWQTVISIARFYHAFKYDRLYIIFFFHFLISLLFCLYFYVRSMFWLILIDRILSHNLSQKDIWLNCWLNYSLTIGFVQATSLLILLVFWIKKLDWTNICNCSE